VLDRARERGVRTASSCPPCASPRPTTFSLSAKRNPDVWCALGVHPHDAASWTDEHPERLRGCSLTRGRWQWGSAASTSTTTTRRATCRGASSASSRAGAGARPAGDRAQPGLERGDARDRRRPASSAARRLPLLRRRPGDGARAADRRGFYLGVSGMITFPKADNVREVLPPSCRRTATGRDRHSLPRPGPYRGKPNRARLRRRGRRAPGRGARPCPRRPRHPHHEELLRLLSQGRSGSAVKIARAPAGTACAIQKRSKNFH
jgi:TatD DNase family protein